MPISNDSKSALNQKIEELEIRKSAIVKRIQELNDKKDILILTRDAIKDQILALKADTLG